MDLDFETINDLKGKNKFIIEEWNSEMGRGVLFYIKSLDKSNISQIDCKYYIKNRDRLKNFVSTCGHEYGKNKDFEKFKKKESEFE